MTTIRKISYFEALDGVADKDTAEALVNFVESVKNWGDQKAALPGWLVVRLVDTIKVLKEQQLVYNADKPRANTTGEPEIQT